MKEQLKKHLNAQLAKDMILMLKIASLAKLGLIVSLVKTIRAVLHALNQQRKYTSCMVQ